MMVEKIIFGNDFEEKVQENYDKRFPIDHFRRIKAYPSEHILVNRKEIIMGKYRKAKTPHFFQFFTCFKN
jgi:hypothetical protein